MYDDNSYHDQILIFSEVVNVEVSIIIIIRGKYINYDYDNK